MHTSAVDAGAGTPGLQYTRCPSRVHPYMLRVAPVYTVSIPRPPLHAARGFSIHSVHPVSIPTCCAGVEETVASWRGAGASFCGHVQPQGTCSTLPPGAGAPECTEFPELAQQSPRKKVQ